MHVSLSTGDSRVILVGDVHGCYDELRALLDKCGYSRNNGDVVVLVGDLTNKGPKSAEVVRLAVDSGFHAVCGNHDLIALERWDEWRRTGAVPPPEAHGDFEFVSSLRPEDVDYLAGLPLTITLPDHEDTIVVHAGLVPGVPLEQQRLLDMIQIRNVLEVTEGGDSQGVRRYVAHHGVDKGEAWAKAWCARDNAGSPPNTVVFGHDGPRGLQLHPFALGLDSNCCNGGSLTAYVLPAKEVVSVPALGRLHDTLGEVRKWRSM